MHDLCHGMNGCQEIIAYREDERFEYQLHYTSCIPAKHKARFDKNQDAKAM